MDGTGRDGVDRDGTGERVGVGANASSVAFASRQSTTFSAPSKLLVSAARLFSDGTVSGRYVDRGAREGRRPTARICV